MYCKFMYFPNQYTHSLISRNLWYWASKREYLLSKNQNLKTSLSKEWPEQKLETEMSN